MATSLSISLQPGYPTYSSVKIYVSFTVTYAASYTTRFWLYDETGSLVDSATGATYTLAAGGSKSNLTKTFSGLSPNTGYTISAELCNASTGAGLGVTDSVSFTTPEKPVKQWYLKLVLHGNGGATASGLTTYTYSGSKKSDTDNAVPVAYDGTVFTRSGYTLAGFDASSAGVTVDTPPKGTFTMYSSSNDASNPTVVHLYAVWEEIIVRPSNWAWASSVSQGGTVTVSGTGKTRNAAYLTAAEWNRFLDRIVAFLRYRGYTVSSNPAYVTAGTEMLASQVNGAIQMIALMDPPTALPAEVSAGDLITAALINGLKNSLNSIP